MSLTVRILIALVAGLGCGILLAEWGGAWDAAIVGVVLLAVTGLRQEAPA